jgi:hypothetical protein
MKVINIRIPYDLESIDIENDEIDVSVDTDEPYTYVLSVATPKHIQFRMDEQKKDIFGPGYPLIFVNKLTPEIIEQAVKAFAEESRGYWLKMHHFGGCGGVIDKSIFDQLRAKHNEESVKLNQLDELSFIEQTKLRFEDPANQTDILYLLGQYRTGNLSPSFGIRAVSGTCLSELRTSRGTSIYFQEKNDIIEVVAISEKNNRRLMIAKLKLAYQEKK